MVFIHADIKLETVPDSAENLVEDTEGRGGTRARGAGMKLRAARKGGQQRRQPSSQSPSKKQRLMHDHTNHSSPSRSSQQSVSLEDDTGTEEGEESRRARGRSPSGREYWETTLTDLMLNRKTFRAPFKVLLMSWSPCMDLLALVSEKGDVCLKRQPWKTAWKLNVNAELRAVHSFTPPTSSSPCSSSSPSPRCSSPSSLAWSPDGLILAIGMADGIFHLIDAEAGVLRFSWQLTEGCAIDRLTWAACSVEKESELERMDPVKPSSWDPVKDLFVEEVVSVAILDPPTDENGADRVHRAKDLERTLFARSLHNTLLISVQEDTTITILIAGVLKIASFNFGEYMLSKYEMAVLSVCDVLYLPVDQSVVVMYAGGAGSIDVSTGNCYAADMKKTTSSRHNHVVSIGIRVLNERCASLSLLSIRFIKMYAEMTSLMESYEQISKFWQSESTKMTNRFTMAGFNLGEAMLSMILTSVSSDAFEKWVTERVGAEGIAALRDFIDKHLVSLQTTLRGTMMSSASNIGFQLSRFLADLCEHFEDLHCYSSDPMLKLFGRRNEDVSVYPYGGVGLSSSSLPSDARPHSPVRSCPHYRNWRFTALEARRWKASPIYSPSFSPITEEPSLALVHTLRQMVTVAERNGHELAQIIRWISLFSPLLVHSKKQLSLIRQCRKYDGAEMIRFVIENFLEGETREHFERIFYGREPFSLMEKIDLSNTPRLPTAAELEAAAALPIPAGTIPQPFHTYRTRKSSVSSDTSEVKAEIKEEEDDEEADLRMAYARVCPRGLANELKRPLDPETREKWLIAQVRALFEGRRRGPDCRMNALEMPKTEVRPLPGGTTASTSLCPGTSSANISHNSQTATFSRSNTDMTVGSRMAPVNSKGQCFQLDKVSEFFRAGTPLPENVRRLLGEKREGVDSSSSDPLSPSFLSLPDAISGVVSMLRRVFTAVADATEDPISVQWAHDLTPGNEEISLYSGKLFRWKWSENPESVEEDIKKEHQYDSSSFKDVVGVLGWSSRSLRLRTLSTPDKIFALPEHLLESLQASLATRSEEQDTQILELLSSPKQPRKSSSSCLGLSSDEQIPPLLNEPLTVDVMMDEEAAKHSADGVAGVPLEICGASPLPGGFYYFLMSMKTASDGCRRRLVRGHPKQPFTLLMHEDVLRPESYEQVAFNGKRMLGAALTDGGSRVTCFELREPGNEEDAATLLPRYAAKTPLAEISCVPNEWPEHRRRRKGQEN